MLNMEGGYRFRLRTACAQFVRNLRLNTPFANKLSTSLAGFILAAAEKYSFVPPLLNTFCGRLYSTQLVVFTSVPKRFYTLSTPPITTVSPLKRINLLLEEGA